MDTASLMTLFADPATIKSLPLQHKLIGGLITAVLGMGITFLCLIVLQFVIGQFHRLAPAGKTAASPAPAQVPAPAAAVQENSGTELVAAISVALATVLNTSADKIIIRHIRHIEDEAPAWNRTSRLEQMLDQP